MGRQKKQGLSWFPLVVDFFADKRIRRLISRFGSDGALFYIYILCSVYENGYYVPYSDDFIEDAALDLGCTVEKIGLMVNYLLDKSLLDRKLFDTVKVLSSHGIQIQYQESKKRLDRDIEIQAEFWLLNESETQSFVSVRPFENKSAIYTDKSAIYSDKSAIYAPNKIKENKTKEKETKEKENTNGGAAEIAVIEKPNVDEALSEFYFEANLETAVRDWLAYKQEKRQSYKPVGLRVFLDKISRAEKKYGGDAVAEAIRNAMSCNYQGIVWDKIDRFSKPQQNDRLGWIDGVVLK